MIVQSQLQDAPIQAAQASLGDEIIYVTYGDVVEEMQQYEDGFGDIRQRPVRYVSGTTERIGHLIDMEAGETYPQTEEELRVVLESIVSH